MPTISPSGVTSIQPATDTGGSLRRPLDCVVAKTALPPEVMVLNSD